MSKVKPSRKDKSTRNIKKNSTKFLEGLEIEEEGLVGFSNTMAE
jgi:hypothetical protein